jgi:dTDP-4-amino-4,6-dideoxygalactose transaminase
MIEFIPLASPDIQIVDIEAVNRVLRSGMLVQGVEVENLEKNLADYLGVEQAIMVSNGTASLHLMLEALGIGPGDEVIVPAFSYIATANVVELVGAKPVFVDIEKHSFNIDKNQIIEKITPSTKAIMIVHEFGLAADIHEIKSICDKHGIMLLEDAACALGAKEKDLFAGSLGKAGSFSFHPRKAITSGEGGAIVTNDAKLAAKIRALRNHGINAEIVGKMDFIYAGFNYRLTDFQAALLNSQLDRINWILEKKQMIAYQYLNEINNPLLQLPTFSSTKYHAWQTFHVLLHKSMNQADCIKHFRANGIGVNYGAQCMPEQTFFKNKYNHDSQTEFPNAYTAYTQGLALPLYEKLNSEQIQKIIDTVNQLKTNDLQ